MNPPKNAKEVKTFLRLVGYFPTLIKNFAQMAKPLIALTHCDARFAWTSSHCTVFNILKNAVLETPIFTTQTLQNAT